MAEPKAPRQTDAAAELAAAPAAKFFMLLDNSIHTDGGALSVGGEDRDAVDGFVVVKAGETVEAKDDAVVQQLLQLVSLGRARGTA